MLKQRVITAVLLLLVLLAALFAPVEAAFGLLMAVVMAAAAWEWARLSGCQSGLCWASAVLAAGACALMTSWGWHASASEGVRLFVTLASLAWLGLAPWLLRAGVPVWQRIPTPLRLAMGLFVLCAAWLAAVQLHGRFGVWYLLSVLALAWAADISAYFAGRAFGKRKLAPSISPGKSWAGVYGGLAGALVLALVCAQLPVANFHADVAGRAGIAVLLLVVAALTAMSVVGDLVESLMKRSMGMKDSSQLLPGHGGILDRIDALLPVLPLALTVTLWLA
ncbi:MAG: phosphatidate cytidylyltransferase [Brachymonas denitrificans]